MIKFCVYKTLLQELLFLFACGLKENRMILIDTIADDKFYCLIIIKEIRVVDNRYSC